jgi:hypothetical protein
MEVSIVLFCCGKKGDALFTRLEDPETLEQVLQQDDEII